MPGFIFHPYTGDPLDDKSEWLAALGLAQDVSYTLVVPTPALELSRGPYCHPHQENDRGPQLVFHKALRHFMGREHILSRSIERLLLQRAMREISTSVELASQLKHDVFAWRDALTYLDERGIDLSQGFPLYLGRQLVNPKVGELLSLLQERFRLLQAQESGLGFEAAARNFLEEKYQPTPVVVFEGFTFLRPLQRYYAEICAQRGADVHFLFPYRPDQSVGFEALTRTYSVDADTKVLATASIDRPEDLQRLRDNLFGEAISGFCADGSVTIEAYRHRHQEVAACIRRVKEYLESGAFDAADIAIVVPDPQSFRSLLVEEAEFQRLPVSLSIPPRMLLMTPVGRFALTLYRIWDKGVLKMSDEQFESILASGWLGAHVQATVERFSALRDQIFARCSTTSEWRAGIAAAERLGNDLRRDSRIPAAHVTASNVRLWRQALTQIETLCKKLFSGGPKPLQEHIELLLDQLSQLDPEVVRHSEREIIERIREALLNVGTSETLSLDAEEFGEILSGLAREYEQTEEENPDEIDQDRIWVASPEGVDGCSRRVVFLLGADNQRMPRAFVDPWPFYHREIDQHQEKERYRFLSVVRAATERLHMSYARADERSKYGASLYLDEAVRVLGSQIESIREQTLEFPQLIASSAQVLQARREEYELSEVAHFGLCPFRYKLERLDKRIREYTDSFQLSRLVQSRWLELIMELLKVEQVTALGREQRTEMFEQAKEATRNQVMGEFPGLHPAVWITAERYLYGSWDYETRYCNENFDTSVDSGEPDQYVIIFGDRTVTVEVDIRYALRRGSIREAFLSEQLFEEWLWPGKRPANNNASARVQVDGLQLFASQWHAREWWAGAMKANFELRESGPRDPKREQKRQVHQRYRTEIEELVKAIESGNYPKHSGDHCRDCPAQAECLGLEP